MSRFTVLRVEVDSDVVERVLGLTPGVEVVEGFDADGPRDDERAPRADERQRPTEADDEGLLDRATPDGDLVEPGSPLREYGLLGLGVSFVMLGIATVGIWWYRRRKGGDDSEFEHGADTTPTAFDERTTEERGEAERTTDERTPAERTPDERTPSETATESDATDTERETDSTTDDDSLSIVTPDDESDETEPTATDESAGRTEDREAVEWEPKWDTEPKDTDDEGEDADADAADESDETDIDAADERASESVDVAPLLGVAFLAVTGAVVRWVRGADQ